MDYKLLGRTGCRVSRVILGCGNFGGIGSAPAFFGQGQTEKEAFALMDLAWELGINVFDTADAYGGGRSEEMIGRWLEMKGSAIRDQLLVCTKVFNPVGPGPNDHGLSRRHIVRQVDASLRRLGAEAIDLYMIHEVDPSTPLEQVLRTLDDLIRAGKVRFVGASNIAAWQVAKSLWISDVAGLTRFEWIQNSYSLLDRRDERELFPLCADQGLGFTPFSPLAGGWLAGLYREGEPYPADSRMAQRPEAQRHLERSSTFTRLRGLGELARSRGVSMAGLGLAWHLHHPAVTAPIVGPAHPDHFQSIREALELRLSATELGQLDRLFSPDD